MSRSMGKVLVTGILVGALIVLPGCENPFGDSKEDSKDVALQTPAASREGVAEGGRVLVRARGKAYVAEEPFNKKLAQMLQASPYTRGMDIATLPAEAKLNFLKDWVKFLLIRDVWGSEREIEKDADFQKKLAEHVSALKDSLVIDAFVNEVRKGISVSADDVKKEYEVNRERYVKAPGGARMASARVTDSEAADTLHKRARRLTSIDDFESLANSVDGAEYSDHGLVNATYAYSALASLPQAVQRAMLDVDCPRSSVVQTDDGYWVIFCAEKRKAEYYAFDEIKDQIKGLLEETRQKEIIEEQVEKFSQSVNLEIDEAVFSSGQQNVRVVTPEELAAAVKQPA